MVGLWLFLAIIALYVVVALVIRRREQRPSQIDWSREVGGPPAPTTSRAVSSDTFGGTGGFDGGTDAGS